MYWDGISTKYQISFYPIYDLDSLPPIVVINTWSIAVPIWTVLTEWTEYTLNYQNGEIIFQSGHIPPELLDVNGDRTVTAKVSAYHCKINLKQFLEFFNNCRQHLAQWFPIKGFQEVTHTDLGVDENAELLELDLNQSPFTNYLGNLEFFQEKDGKKHLTYYRRDNWVFFDSPNSEWPTYYPVGPTDYWRGPTPARRAAQLPFWIFGYKAYPLFDLSLNANTFLSTDTLLVDNTASVENVMIKIALMMYQYRLHFSERMNASTLRMSTMKEVQGMVMSLSMDLQKHTGLYATGSGTIAPTDITN